MLITKELNTSQDLDTFAALYLIESKGHKPVNTTYLRQCLVRVFYHAEAPNEWRGGYVLNSKAPYRYFEVLNKSLQSQLLLTHGISENHISEVTCIWIKSKEMTPTERMQIYFTSMVDAFATGKPYIFGGSTEPKVVALQQQIMPHSFHSGATYMGDKFTDYWIYYTGRAESVFTMLQFIMSQSAKPLPESRDATAVLTPLTPENEMVI